MEKEYEAVIVYELCRVVVCKKKCIKLRKGFVRSAIETYTIARKDEIRSN